MRRGRVRFTIEPQVMQTFLPYESFLQTAKCLDNKRLSKQILQCSQLMLTLTGQSDGWKNHPCTKMWTGHEYWLARYGVLLCDEWSARGFSDTVKPMLWNITSKIDPSGANNYPAWLSSRRLHLSHQGNLLRKDPDHYSKFQFCGTPDLPYYWPVK